MSQHKILIAFLLNLGFSVYELIGGTITGSTAIVSDAVHDFGDAISIGLSYLLEKKSTKQPDAKYTYGYTRYSLVGGMVTTLILLFGSTFVIFNAILRLFNPIEINYNGMIILSLIGVTVNFIAAYITRDNNSLNQKSVNLHMLEDVLGWVVVLLGAIIMRFTNISLLDPILSILVALFILWQTILNFRSILNVFLEKTPNNISLDLLITELQKIPDITNVHHLHVWSIDGFHNYATLHVVTKHPAPALKTKIRDELKKHHISHTTIEFENPKENCSEHECHLDTTTNHHTHIHHHH